MKKTDQQIQRDKFYRPMEVARLGLIQNSKGDKSTVSGNYNFILELIKSGKLKAKNYSTGKKLPSYLISATEIDRYLKSI